MAAVKEWAMQQVEELYRDGFSKEDICILLDCEIDFVEAIVGVVD